MSAFRTAWSEKFAPRVVEYVHATYEWTSWLTNKQVKDSEFAGIWGARRGEHKVSDLQRAHFFEWSRTGV